MAEIASSASPHARSGYPKRLTLDLSEDDHNALLGGRHADRVPMADQMRAVVSLWQENPALAEAVSIRAQDLLLTAHGAHVPSRIPDSDGGPSAVS